MKKVFRLLLLLVVVITALFYGYIKFTAASDGEMAPDFEATLIDGTPFKLSDVKGNYVLLDFWGSWCPPCRKENPKLVELHKKYSDKLTIVTIALEKDGRYWKKASQKDGFVWKHQIVDQNRLVLMSSIARKYGVSEIPAKFLISPEGKLIGKPTFHQIDSLFRVIQ